MHCREGFDERDSIRFGVLEAGAQVRRLGAVQGVVVCGIWTKLSVISCTLRASPQHLGGL
jgi:hypothetical protein